MLKKIDRLLIKSFLPPFILTFFIALFVLIMSFLWSYVDQIIGKGADIFILSELIFYLSISLFPTALPIAVLISTVMVMGNLAERYELTSLKSAGVPLLRTMAPLMVVCFAISVFSYISADRLIPVANLQFKTRLFDIRRNKPTLNLEQGVFNDDFKGFVMYIGEKAEDDRSIKDILIYDHNRYNKNTPPRLLAKDGEMFISEDKRYFVMNLFDGNQYQEVSESGPQDKKTYPFSRVKFKEWSKVFDLSEFSIDQSDQRVYKSHHAMLSSRQLSRSIDSLGIKVENKFIASANMTSKSFSPYKDDFKKEFIKVKETYNLDQYNTPTQKPSSTNKNNIVQKKNTSKKTTPVRNVPKKNEPKKTKKQIEAQAKGANKTQQEARRKRLIESKKKLEKRKTSSLKKGYAQVINNELSEYSSFAELFEKANQKSLVTKAKTNVTNTVSQLKANRRSLNRIRETRVKHIYEKHSKFTISIACFVFLFIGAPMGAIIRKGGFGFPILVAIVFFVLFTVMNIFCKKVAETFVINAVLATWLPILILIPIGVFLTSRAMADKKVVDFDQFLQPLISFFQRFSKKSKSVD